MPPLPLSSAIICCQTLEPSRVAEICHLVSERWSFQRVCALRLRTLAHTGHTRLQPYTHRPRHPYYAVAARPGEDRLIDSYLRYMRLEEEVAYAIADIERGIEVTAALIEGCDVQLEAVTCVSTDGEVSLEQLAVGAGRSGIVVHLPSDGDGAPGGVTRTESR